MKTDIIEFSQKTRQPLLVDESLIIGFIPDKSELSGGMYDIYKSNVDSISATRSQLNKLSVKDSTGHKIICPGHSLNQEMGLDNRCLNWVLRHIKEKHGVTPKDITIFYNGTNSGPFHIEIGKEIYFIAPRFINCV